MVTQPNAPGIDTGAVHDATVTRSVGGGRTASRVGKPVTGAGLAVDVLLVGVAAGVTWWLSENIPLIVIIALEIIILALFVWRITGTTPGSLIARLAFGIGAAPAVSEDETRLAVRRVSDRGFADAVPGEDWTAAAAQAAIGAPSAAAPPQQIHSTAPHEPGDLPPQPWPAHPTPEPAQQWQHGQPMQQAGGQVPGPAVQDAPAPLPSPVSGSEPQNQQIVQFQHPQPHPLANQVNAAGAAPVPQDWLLVLPNGERVAVVEPLMVGRKPRPENGEVPIELEDEARSISRSHLVIVPRPHGPVVIDLNSANGTRVRRAGQEHPVMAGGEFPLALGDVVVLGKFELELQ